MGDDQNCYVRYVAETLTFAHAGVLYGAAMQELTIISRGAGNL